MEVRNENLKRMNGTRKKKAKSGLELRGLTEISRSGPGDKASAAGENLLSPVMVAEALAGCCVKA